jgi:hypothetical protein
MSCDEWDVPLPTRCPDRDGPSPSAVDHSPRQRRKEIGCTPPECIIVVDVLGSRHTFASEVNVLRLQAGERVQLDRCDATMEGNRFIERRPTMTEDRQIEIRESRDERSTDSTPVGVESTKVFTEDLINGFGHE